jgi:nitrogen regulatory protein P-II 1
VKLISVVLRPPALEAVQDALALFGVRGMTVGEVFLADPDLLRFEVYRGQVLPRNLEPRVRIELLVADEDVTDLTRVITRIARPTILVVPVDVVVRVRTGERGRDAL